MPVIASLKCPNCSKTTRVLETRHTPEGIRRYRGCNFCSYRFHTHEGTAEATLIIQQQQDRIKHLENALRKISAALDSAINETINESQS